MKGKVLAINTGSTSTKIGYFVDGEKVFEQNIYHSARQISVYASVLDQRDMRRNAITDFFAEKGIHIWVDLWGYDVNHDWPWWHKQVAYFVPKLLEP